MINLMNKARTGRTDALEGRQNKTDNVMMTVAPAMMAVAPIVEFKSSRNTNTMAFVSTRAQVATSNWLH